jgi:cytochrome c-type biogenesis protein CcmH
MIRAVPVVRSLPRAAASDVALALLAGLALFAVVASAVVARPRPPDERARLLEAEIRCPTCAGESIVDSSAPIAAEMRTLVSQQVAAGATDDEVRAWFVARYGAWIVLDPTAGLADGPSVPLLVVVAAVGVVLVAWSRRGGRSTVVAAATPLPAVRHGPAKWTRRARRRAERARTAGAGAGRASRAGGLEAFHMRLPVARIPRPAIPRPRVLRTAGRVRAMRLAPALPVVPAVVLAALLAATLGPTLPRATGAAAATGEAQLEALRSAADAAPGDIDAQLALAGAYASAGRSEDAVSAYDRALAIDANSEPGLIGLALVLIVEGDAPDAGPLLDQVLAADPDQPDALIYRALARSLLDPTDARVRADALRFLSLVPDDPRRTMAQALLSAADPSAADPSAAPTGAAATPPPPSASLTP